MSCYAVNTTDLSFGYSDSVVLDFISRLPSKNCDTNISLLNKLSNIGIIDTKTEETTLRYKKDYQLHQNTDVVVVRWNENSVETVALETGTALFICGEEEFPQPRLIAQHNGFMREAVRMDQHVAAYRISIRSKKWWWHFVPFCAGCCSAECLAVVPCDRRDQDITDGPPIISTIQDCCVLRPVWCKHRSHLSVCLLDSLDLTRCLSILFWTSACE